MKVLHVSLSYKSASALGGPDTNVYKLCTALERQGVEIDVIATNLASKREVIQSGSFERQVDGVRARYLETRKLFPLGKSSFGPFYMPELASVLRKEIRHYDIVHIHGFRDYFSVVASHQAYRAEIPYLMHPRGTLPYQGHSYAAKWLFDHIVGKKILDRAARLIALSQREIESYVELSQDTRKVHVLYNGIDPRDYDPKIDSAPFRKKYNIREKYVVLYLGRIHQIKGIETMLRAVILLRRAGIDAAAVVIGPDEGYGQIVREIARTEKFMNMYLLPTVSGIEKNRALVAADALVYAAKVEDFGIVAFEGVLSGVPTIVAQETGCGEVMRQLDAAYQISYGDVAGLTQVLQRILADPDEARRWTLEARARVVARLNWDDIALQLKRIYHEILTHD